MPKNPEDDLSIEDLDTTEDVKGGAGHQRFDTPSTLSREHATGVMDRPRRRPIVDISKGSPPRDK